MGCDIHCFVEYRSRGRQEEWLPFGKEMHGDRNYDMFTLMAGVRSDGKLQPLFKPKGILNDLSWESDSALWITPSSPEIEQRYIKFGSIVRIRGNSKEITNPDWHTHSWLTHDEFEKCCDSGHCSFWYRAVSAAMRSLEESGNETRIVFWFDN